MDRAKKSGQLTLLGTGTSFGVPVIGCRCAVCTSSDPRNRRRRCSALVEIGDTSILIDVTPDFRTQALEAGIDRLDGVIITHCHADHAFGIDDLRALSPSTESPLSVFADAAAGAELTRMFRYIFHPDHRVEGVASLALREARPGERFTIGEVEILPFHYGHAGGHTLGVRIGDFAYVTDAKEFDDEALDALCGVKLLVLDMLREEPHPTHLALEESLALHERLDRPETWFIHMTHDVDHEPFDARLPDGCRLAWDGLVLELPIGE